MESPPAIAPASDSTVPESSAFRAELVWLDPRRWAPLFAEVPREIWVVAITAAVGLTLHELIFLPSLASFYISRWFPSVAHDLKADGAVWAGVARYVWWAGGSFLVWVVLPLLAGRVLAGRSPREYGFAPLPFKKMGPYLVILGVMIPVVVFAALVLPGFTNTYPFYRPSNGPWLLRTWLAFELLYGLQFVTVEFFFRGFVLQGFGRYIGYRAIFVSMIPYVMVHFHKPLLEALAAIIAGIVLGAFALRTRTIVGGLLIHLGVAYGMDLISLAMGSRGGFPTEW